MFSSDANTQAIIGYNAVTTFAFYANKAGKDLTGQKMLDALESAHPGFKEKLLDGDGKLIFSSAPYQPSVRAIRHGASFSRRSIGMAAPPGAPCGTPVN